jgi:hypothetical protein
VRVFEFGVEGGVAAIGAEGAAGVGWYLAHGGDDRAPGDELRFILMVGEVGQREEWIG